MKKLFIGAIVPCFLSFLMVQEPLFGGVVPVVSPFYAGAEQTDDRMIYVGGSGSGGKLAVDCHADFMLARDDSNVVQNWCNAGTFKWSFGFFSFDGPSSEYPSFNSNLNGSTALTFDGGDKMRMVLEPGFGYTLPSEITDGVLTVEMWIQNPSVQTGEVLMRFEDGSNVDLTASQFNMSNSNSWQHLVAVSDGSQITFYNNDLEVGTQAGALSFSGNAVINLGAQSFTGSIAAIRVHTEQMTAADISHNYAGGVGLGTYLFYPIHDTEIEHEWYGDPDRSVDPEVDLRWHESAHFRSMWDEAKNPNPGDDIGARIVATQLDNLETMYTYFNEKSGKHLPLVSNDEDKRGDGRKYKWIVGNGWYGLWSGSSPMALGYGVFYAGYHDEHEYVHGTDGHQLGSLTSQWNETHANFQPSWLGTPQVNPVTASSKFAHVYPSTGGNYYHDYLIWDHLVETPEFGGLYVTRIRNRGPNSGDGGRNYPPKAMEEMDPSPGTPFNEEWVKMAARNITWDYPSHPEYATKWAGLEYKTRNHFTLLQEVPYLAAGWYEPPKWRTPQQHGYNICILEPNPGTVTADLTGHIDSARGSAWSAMFVAVDNGTPRYGSVFANGTQGNFTVQSGDDELYLVVVATPTNILEIGIFSSNGKTDYRGAPKDRFPYQVQLGGTTPKATAWMPSAANNGTVDPTAYVAPTAYIASGAQVLDNARVEDYAQVYGTVSGNAVVSGYAIIESNATVTDNALVSDYAIIRGGSSIYGDARVLEHADIYGVDIYDYAICKGNSEVSGPIHGNAMIDGNYIKSGDRDKGYWFLWSWGDGIQDGELDQDFGGLFLEYQFEQQNAYRVWDTYGATWGRLINGASYASDSGGTVLDLDGVDQFVDLHSSVATSIDVTFVVDVKWDGGANGQRIFEFSNPNGDVCWLSPSDSQGKLSFGINVDGVEQVVRAANPLPTGVWKTVSVMMYDDTAIVQVDDFNWGSNDAFTHDVKDVSASVCYLGRGASDGYFDGRMDNFTIWSRSLIDVHPPTPGPAEFFLEPVAVTETEVAMFSALGADSGGNIEYNFEEALGGTGADDSGWQGSRKYWDQNLDSGVSEYVYRVTMRDGSGNMTDASAATRLTWQTTDMVYSQAADATGLAVIEAENYGRKAAGIKGYEWELNTSAAGYLGTGAMRVPNGGRAYSQDYDVQSPRMDYFIDFAKTGNHWVWVRAHGSSRNDDSYHLGDDMHASSWGYYQAWGTHGIYHWMRKGPFSVDSTGVHTINLWMREDGTRIDRLLVTSDDAYVPTAQTDGEGNVIGDGPAESASVTKSMLFKAALTDNTAPTPDPATFATNPAAVSGYIISMTATAGDDASGLQYYFEETSGTPGGSPGGTDSGWQSSATYSDSRLTPDTSYSYRVRMRDVYGNTTGWSAIESASTTNEIDDQAPTPNVALFDVAPYPAFPRSLTMTAVVGTDGYGYGSVEYYFTETSGAPGGSNSGWQSSPTYTDYDLSSITQYTYTVMMRDGLGNVGTASAPVSGTPVQPQVTLSDGHSGDYRIIFVTADTTLAQATTIGIYNTFVNTQAGLAGATETKDFVTTWTAVGSTKLTSAAVNTGTTGAGTGIHIYTPQGSGNYQLVATSYDALWNAASVDILTGIHYGDGTEAGDGTGGERAWTGTNPDGSIAASGDGHYLGSGPNGDNTSQYMRSVRGGYTDGNWISGVSNHDGISQSMMGMSGVLTTPPPETDPAITNKNPADGDTNVAIDANLVATFDEDIALTGGGTITIRDLGAGADVVIALPDAQVTVSGAVLTINPTNILLPGNAYAVRISADAVEDLATTPNAFAGILNDTAWNFDTAVAFVPVAGVTVVDIGVDAHSDLGTSDWNTCLTLDASGNAYAAFVDSNFKNTVAKVTPGGVVTTQIIDTTDNEDDAHNTPSIAIDGDGFLHVAYNMHVDNMLMRKSPAANSVGDTEWVVEGGTGTPWNSDTFTYPAMSTAPNGDVYMTVRYLGNYGVAQLFRYNNTAGSWSSIAKFAGEGGYTAYLPAPYVASDGKVHLVWHWAQGGSGGIRHLGSYAVYDPSDGSFSKADGTEYTIPITTTTADPYQPREADWGEKGISDHSVTVNALGQPIIAYNFFREGDNDQRVLRLSRWDGSVWQRTDLEGPATGTTLGDPVIVNRDGTLHIYYNDADGKLTLRSSVDNGLTFGDAITLTANAVRAAHVLIGGTSIGSNQEAIFFLDTSDNYAAKVMFVDYAQVADADSDGLPDLWEDEHFGDNDGTPTPAELLVSDGSGDFDGDGTPDLAEFRLGLIPTDATSAFTLDVSPGLAADSVALSWPSQEGLQFEIYFTDDLSQPLANWSVISPITDDDDDGAPTHEWTDADAASHPMRFYRVGLLP